MKVALIGYGKMGQAIETLLKERGHQISAIFGPKGINKKELALADVAIEFSHPEAAFANLRTCFSQKIPVVIGTTGWLHNYDETVQLCQSQGGALLYASNFSLGVNLFFALNKRLAQLMEPYGYNVALSETHHTQKKDAPSGTAITLAEQIIAANPQLNGYTLAPEKNKNKISITAIREADIPGTHSIKYNSEIDQIEITHTAKSRQGFALGAVLAAEFLKGKTGVFSMQDVLKIND
jgi:4-hydroxy-tetrahydrodipicolinate reductase